jgi:deoxycytidine triphosphate deaminase
MQDTFGVMHVRSSLSRKGIFMSFGLFDSGFCGNGGVSIYNMSGSKLELPKGFRVCQMVIYKGDPAKMYSGHYNQTTSVESKLK